MTTLAEDIKALMDLGHTLERATDLATQDRAKSVGKKASIPPFTSHHIFSAVNNLPLTSFLLFSSSLFAVSIAWNSAVCSFCPHSSSAVAPTVAPAGMLFSFPSVFD